MKEPHIPASTPIKSTSKPTCPTHSPVKSASTLNFAWRLESPSGSPQWLPSVSKSVPFSLVITSSSTIPSCKKATKELQSETKHTKMRVARVARKQIASKLQRKENTKRVVTSGLAYITGCCCYRVVMCRGGMGRRPIVDRGRCCFRASGTEVTSGCWHSALLQSREGGCVGFD